MGRKGSKSNIKPLVEWAESIITDKIVYLDKTYYWRQ